MPSILTHYLFGLDATNNIKNLEIYQSIKKYRHIYFFGLQGPDPMYYHAPLKKENYYDIAYTLHNKNTGNFIKSLLEFYTTLDKSSQMAQCCLAYICGFIGHYVLDFSTHPYIYYIGGNYDKNDPKTDIYMGLHNRIELAIDSILIQEKYKVPSHLFKIHKHILKLDSLPPCVLDMFKYSMKMVFDIEEGDKILDNSYKSMKLYYKLTFDRLGFKKKLYSVASPCFSIRLASQMRTLSYYECEKEYIDYLNLNKSVWFHPVTGTLHTHSFYDLMKDGHKVMTQLMADLDDFNKGQLSFWEMADKIPDLSYCTALPECKNQEMSYFKIISEA
ncbi:MAG: hypothetical protein ATN36_01555 [Epulopiscium sp. Nele67-Bin005]|nr:MAG: hypothetical protein ATN36_01555 [Epulopiscium sp. Nele67-Bin005]